MGNDRQVAFVRQVTLLFFQLRHVCALRLQIGMGFHQLLGMPLVRVFEGLEDLFQIPGFGHEPQVFAFAVAQLLDLGLKLGFFRFQHLVQGAQTFVVRVQTNETARLEIILFPELDGYRLQPILFDQCFVALPARFVALGEPGVREQRTLAHRAFQGLHARS